MKVEERFVYDTFAGAVPGPANASVVEYAEKCVRLVSSPTGETFDRRTKPWLNPILECATVPGKYSFVKPIQNGGGTTAGEIIILYWLGNWHSGSVFYYWPNDLKADDRFVKYTEKMLRACRPVMDRLPPDRNAWTKGLILFNTCNFAQLGVRTSRNLSSDTVRGIVAEELHDIEAGWESGKIEQMRGRQAAVWNAISFLISNASQEGDEFHQEVKAGTCEEWEVLCPGCKQFHIMRARWEPERPDLGGLCYNADGCRRNDGSYDYPKLLSSLHYSMPCGFKVPPSLRERRALSLNGRYSEPYNKSALPNHRSFRIEAVACHESDWLGLVIQKHKALRALKNGDPRPLSIYLREQESLFWNPALRPSARPLELSDRKKDREGMLNRQYRFGSLDWQLGEGDTPSHWWGLIVDVDAQANALIVYEGRCVSDGEAVEVMSRHGVRPNAVAVDSGSNTKHVYEFCLKNGFNAIKAVGDKSIRHPSTGTWHAWSEREPLWTMANRTGPTRDNPVEEPEFWRISKTGALDLLSFMRSGARRFEVPSDVSEDFKRHFAVWNLEDNRIAATNQIEKVWKKSSERAHDHLLICASYIAVFVDMLEADGAFQQEPARPPKEFDPNSVVQVLTPA